MEVGVHRRGEITLDQILDDVKRRVAGEAGAIACFIGTVRGRGLKGGRVLRLEYEAEEELALKSLESIRRELLEKWGLKDLRIHHIIGEVPVGEDTIYIVAASEHRREALEAVKEAIDRVKKEVPIWKKEVTEEESYWVSELGTS